jgi:quercetin dioxygenase-like cupin family protein
MRVLGLLCGVITLAAARGATQDPLKVDPQHYKLDFENAQVRVLRIRYGPHEKSVMHSHPAGVAVFINDNRAKFTFPDGKSTEREWKAGEAMWIPAETHLPENQTDRPLELILTELKAKPASSGKPKRGT